MSFVTDCSPENILHKLLDMQNGCLNVKFKLIYWTLSAACLSRHGNIQDLTISFSQLGSWASSIHNLLARTDFSLSKKLLSVPYTLLESFSPVGLPKLVHVSQRCDPSLWKVGQFAYICLFIYQWRNYGWWQGGHMPPPHIWSGPPYGNCGIEKT